MRKTLFLPAVAFIMINASASENPYSSFAQAELDQQLKGFSLPSKPTDDPYNKGSVTVGCIAINESRSSSSRPTVLETQIVLKLDNIVNGYKVDAIEIPDYEVLHIAKQDENTIYLSVFWTKKEEIFSIKPKQVYFHVGEFAVTRKTYIPKKVFYDTNSCRDVDKKIKRRNQEIEEYDSKPTNRLKNFFGF